MKFVVLVAVVALVVVACGGSSEDGALGAESPTTVAVPVPAPSTPALEPATRAVDPAPEAAPAEGVELITHELLVEQVARVLVPEDEGAVMVVIVDADGTAVHASEGTDPDGNAPTPDDAFRVGSITKTFTALATLTLVDEGLVELDAPASDYVTRVDVPEGVTVRHLLQHTSGIPNFTDDPSFVSRVVDDPSRVWTPEEGFALVADDEPLFAPGGEFRYSNTNYIVLGVLIEEVSGQPAAEVIRARILEPLALDSTYLSGFEAGPDPFGAYTSLSGSPAPIDFDYTSIETDAWTAGAMVSSARDLHTLFTAVLDGQVISPASLAAMTAGRSTRTDSRARGDEYGFGLLIDGFGTMERLFGHGGGIVGYRTLVAHAPQTGKTAFWVATGARIDFQRTVSQVATRIAAG